MFSGFRLCLFGAGAGVFRALSLLLRISAEMMSGWVMHDSISSTMACICSTVAPSAAACLTATEITPIVFP